MTAPFICRGCGCEYEALPPLDLVIPSDYSVMYEYNACPQCREEVVTIEQYAADAADHEQAMKEGPRC